MEELLIKLEEVNKEVYDCYLQWYNHELSSNGYDKLNSELFNRKRRVFADIDLLIDELNYKGRGRHIFNLL